MSCNSRLKIRLPSLGGFKPQITFGVLTNSKYLVDVIMARIATLTFSGYPIHTAIVSGVAGLLHLLSPIHCGQCDIV